ncbi:MAG: outer membrane protein assembly factor BamB [Gammaproteobacteria bacterium]|nr:outer membrane protein assembly factor BamB [Gammaproteobacteria bacterium]
MRLKFLVLISFAISLSGCFLFDNNYKPMPPTPLKKFKATSNLRQLWSNSTSDGYRQGYLQLTPALDNNYIYTTSDDGRLVKIDKTTGDVVWHKELVCGFSTGPVLNDSTIFVGTYSGQIMAIRKSDGMLLWCANLNGEALAAPAVKGGIVVVKTTAGNVYAFDTETGAKLWAYQHSEPQMILRGSSSPCIVGNLVIVGFASGDLVALNLNNGMRIWQRTISYSYGSASAEQLVDIDANPIFYHGMIYAATYQGNIAALTLRHGNIVWQHKLSTYTNLIGVENRIFASDSNGNIWAFGARNGIVAWKQAALAYRSTTAPVKVGSSWLAIADGLGYLHIVGAGSGMFCARTQVVGTNISVPVVADGYDIYVYTSYGRLVKYQLGGKSNA